MGLREAKKEQTRQLIADTAMRLFSERGFETVTVAEVARQARVATATVFNYFPSKEDLFYSGMDVYNDLLIAAVAEREPGVGVLAAFRDFLLDTKGLLELVERGDADALDRLRTAHRVIDGSPTLLAREQQSLARSTTALACLLAEESGARPDDVTAEVVANALIGVQQALITLVRRRVLADERTRAIAADVRTAGTRAFALLERGLAGYAHKLGDDRGRHDV